MDRYWHQRLDERDHGRRRLAWLTGWTAGLAVTLAAAFGVVLAQKDQASAAQRPPDPPSRNPGVGPGQPSGTPADRRPQPHDDDGGPVLPPPPQPPAATGGRGQVNSGGS